MTAEAPAAAAASEATAGEGAGAELEQLADLLALLGIERLVHLLHLLDQRLLERVEGHLVLGERVAYRLAVEVLTAHRLGHVGLGGEHPLAEGLRLLLQGLERRGDHLLLAGSGVEALKQPPQHPRPRATGAPARSPAVAVPAAPPLPARQLDQ